MTQTIILNGSSSAGKTTLATKLQQLLPEPWQYLGLDQYRDGMPQRVRGLNAPAGSEGSLGLNVVPVTNSLTAIEFGPYGDRVLSCMRQSVGLFNRQGISVIVDDLLLKPDYVDDYLTSLNLDQTWLIGVHCAAEVLNQRELARPGRFPGTAIEHQQRVHEWLYTYDLEVDTTDCSPRQLAEAVIARLQTPPQALRSMQAARS